MKHDWTADLLTYWDRLRGTRAAPDRSDISPRALGGKLPNIFILRGDAQNAPIDTPSDTNIPEAKQWQFRLAGTRLCTLYGRELRNTRFLSLWHDDVRPWLAEQLHLSGLDYRPLRLEHTSITLNEKSCHFETLLLPLHETDGSLAWMGSMIALDQPLWLGSDALINNHMGLIPHAPAYAPVENTIPPLQNTGMKSVLQVLLDRHHELAPAQTQASETSREKTPAMLSSSLLQNTAENESHQLADTAFARDLLPQLEAIMPSVQIADQNMQHSAHYSAGAAPAHNSTSAAPAHNSTGAAPAHNSAPLTVADLIKSIHPAAPQAETAVAAAKPAYLKLITGGKDKA